MVLTLSGRIDSEHIGELERLVGSLSGTRLILDLTDINLVDQEAIRFLAASEDAGIVLRHCHAYIGEWIRTEHDRPSGGRES